MWVKGQVYLTYHDFFTFNVLGIGKVVYPRGVIGPLEYLGRGAALDAQEPQHDNRIDTLVCRPCGREQPIHRQYGVAYGLLNKRTTAPGWFRDGYVSRACGHGVKRSKSA